MGTKSTSQKSLQNFHARTNLWELFEQHAQQMDCSVDYLINESMRLYATTHGFMPEAAPPRHQMPDAPPPIPRGPGEPTPPPLPLKSTISGRRSPHADAPLPRPTGISGRPEAQADTHTPPPLPRPASGLSHPPEVASAPPPQASADGQAVLTLVFQGRKIPIHTEQFIIGRGSKSSDLAIKDANISRKHAAIILHNGTYYLKDLGSTNGIEFNGKQVDSKRIDEGDVFSVCGYDMHFTYEG